MFSPIPLETQEKIRDLRKLGIPIEQISERLNVGTSSVMRYSTPGFYERKSAQRRDRRRKVWVNTHVDGKRVRVKVEGRRPRPDHCELCGKLAERLQWHHWDDEDLTKGLWVDLRCHYFVEAIEGGLDESHVKKYQELKAKSNTVKEGLNQ